MRMGVGRKLNRLCQFAVGVKSNVDSNLYTLCADSRGRYKYSKYAWITCRVLVMRLF